MVILTETNIKLILGTSFVTGGLLGGSLANSSYVSRQLKYVNVADRIFHITLFTVGGAILLPCVVCFAFICPYMFIKK